MHACTIVARNYLPQARVLTKSFLASHPDGRVTVLVIDGTGEFRDSSNEQFEMLTVGDLVGDQNDLQRMAALYSVLEYATALKPWLLRTLLARGSHTVMYLDPDIQVFSPLTQIDRLAQDHELVLTPHVTSPMPRDGKKTGESTLLSAGMYNLGFIAVGQRSQAFLDFWCARLRRDCVVDPHGMKFVDQRWIDFAPGIFDSAILRDPSYNVAYWNLDHRTLSEESGTYLVTSQPLRFFHFSGYSPQARHLLSKHQMPNPRILLSEDPVLLQLCNEYAEFLESEGYQTSPTKEEYAYSRLANGISFDQHIRRLYRQEVARADRGLCEYPPNPFTIDGAEKLRAWLNEPAEECATKSPISRYIAALYKSRIDVQAAIPDGLGSNQDMLAAWAQQEVVAQRLDRRLVRSQDYSNTDAQVLRELPTWAPPDALRPGFTVIGYLKAELGVGEWGRLTAQAVEAAGIPLATHRITSTTSRQLHPYESVRVDVYDLDTNILAVNADQLPYVSKMLGDRCFHGRYNIGQWAWELEEFPSEWSGSFDLVDEVWAISEFARTSLALVTKKPVFVCPPAIVPPTSTPQIDRNALGLPEKRFIYLFAFDLLSVLERKNPLGLIDAFKRAFPTVDSPLLVLKIINGDQRVADLERIRLAVRDRSDIMIMDQYLTAQEQAALMNAADCYISLHRSEGFGLTMAEAMAIGKPVIATAYSGNMDFMDATIAYLVRWKPGTVPAGCAPYAVGSHWAEPDLDDAARLIRSVFENQSEAARVGERARRCVLEEHGTSARAKFIKQRFEEIQALRARTLRLPQSSANPTRTPTAPQSPVSIEELAASRPRLDAPAKILPKLTRAYRRMVLRAQRHHDDHQVRVNVALAQAVAQLQHKAVEHAQALDTVRLRARLAGLEQIVESLDRGLRRKIETGEVERDQLRDSIASVQEEATRDLKRASAETAEQVLEARRRVDELRVVPFMEDPMSLVTLDDLGRPAIGYRSSADTDGEDRGYASFEDTFRGSEEMIRGRQRVYLTIVEGRSPVVDAGCGRGEMLDLLRSAGIEAIGVDADESMVERCRRKGHKAELEDIHSYLAGQARDSIGAVFSAQVIEHFVYQDVVKFLSETWRVLQPGGVLIAETVNPHSVPAFKTFWTDISHKAPIFPEVAVALCRSAGFDDALVMFPGGTGTLEEDRWREGAYAVVASKRGVDGPIAAVDDQLIAGRAKRVRGSAARTG